MECLRLVFFLFRHRPEHPADRRWASWFLRNHQLRPKDPSDGRKVITCLKKGIRWRRLLTEGCFGRRTAHGDTAMQGWSGKKEDKKKFLGGVRQPVGHSIFRRGAKSHRVLQFRRGRVGSRIDGFGMRGSGTWFRCLESGFYTKNRQSHGYRAAMT